jgi:hypothetical protein
MTKGIFRVVTTAVGGIAAFGVMAHPSIADNPYILSAILLAFDFVVALWMSSQFKYAGDSMSVVAADKGCCPCCVNACTSMRAPPARDAATVASATTSTQRISNCTIWYSECNPVTEACCCTVFLMVITFNLLVLCQHVQIVACTAPSGCPRSGSIQPFYAQVRSLGSTVNITHHCCAASAQLDVCCACCCQSVVCRASARHISAAVPDAVNAMHVITRWPLAVSWSCARFRSAEAPVLRCADSGGGLRHGGYPGHESGPALVCGAVWHLYHSQPTDMLGFGWVLLVMIVEGLSAVASPRPAAVCTA